MSENRMDRRSFLRTAAIVSAATVAAACRPQVVVETVIKEVEKVVQETVIVEGEERVVEKVVKETVVVEVEAERPAGFQGEMEFYAQTYTPTALLPPDPNRPSRIAMQVLANAWMELHPGVKFTFVVNPPDYHAWIETQLLGGGGPDMFWLWLGSLNNFADQGKVVPLNDYLELPNKYMLPDDPSPWKEHFNPPFQETYSPKGLWGGVPTDMVCTGVYVNVDMLREVGIELDDEIDPELGSPVSWARWMEWHEALKDAGYLAFAPAGGHAVRGWWYWGVMTGMLCRSWIEWMDVLNYLDRPLEFQEGIVSTEEINHAYWCMDWEPYDNPEHREVWRLFSEWVPYFADGWATGDWNTMYDYWATGLTCMLWDGSWQVARIQQDDQREFEFSSFWVPPVTKETSAFAADPPHLPIGVGGYGSLSYGINRKCIAKGNVDECVDWLMWINTPDHQEIIVNEQPSFIPSHVKARALPELQNMFVGETRLIAGGAHPVANQFGWFGSHVLRWGDMLTRNIELFGLGEQTLDQTIAAIDREVGVMAPELLRESAIQYDEVGSWDLTQWDCQPDV